MLATWSGQKRELYTLNFEEAQGEQMLMLGQEGSTRAAKLHEDSCCL